MEKINFQNNVTKANAETMTQFQDNIENAINEINYNIITDGEAVKCGYKIDNKDVYVKRINFGALPNNTSKSVNTNIDFNQNTLIKIEGIAKYNSSNVAFSIPFINPYNLSFSIGVNIEKDNIVVTTGSDRSSYNGIFNIYYIGE